MISSTRRFWDYLFYPTPKVEASIKEQKPLWKKQFSALLDSHSNLDTLWGKSLRLTQNSRFHPESDQLDHIKSALAYLPRHCANPQSALKSRNHTTRTLNELVTKIWHNTLRLFTWSYQTKDLEYRHFFSLGDLSIKIIDLTKIVSALVINQYTIDLVCSTLCISTSAAYIATAATVVILFCTTIFFINRYAERVLAKPLKDPTFGDTVNLTMLMQQSPLLSESGRKRELDELEGALVSPTAEVGIIGEKGCGKSELVKLLAQRIAQNSCAPHLKEKQIYCVNGAQVNRSYLERLRETIKGHEEEVILCIDESHGIFKTQADQILKTLGMGGPKPRVIYITTKKYFETTFLAEEDGSWLSRIHPTIEIEPINSRDLHLILLQRFQNHLPWIKISSEIIQPFIEIAQTDLRKAIKDIDLFAAHFLQKINSSEDLAKLGEEKAEAETKLTNLSLNGNYHVWLTQEESLELTSTIRRCNHKITQERKKLFERQNQQKRYQALDLLQKKWQSKTLNYAQNSKLSTNHENEKQLYAACLWAGEVFELKKKNLSEGLITQIKSEEIQDWLASQKTAKPTPSSPKSSKKQPKSSKTKALPNSLPLSTSRISDEEDDLSE